MLAAPAAAQAPGNCELGRAEGEIDVGDVYAKVFNTGSLFFGNSSQAAYIVPKNSGKSPIFAAGLWVGGLVDGELRVAGATYADFEFWPGPLDPATGRPPNPEDCSDYDRIWRVSRHDVAEYYRTGIATRDLAEWPRHLGAPVLDGDGDSTNYDLAAGDQPAISGDQMLWWVMNDVGNYHASSETPPVGIEVQASAFAFGRGPNALSQATFYRYRVINRGAAAVDSAYMMVWADPDLGDASDDASGADTIRHVSFWYNADNQDGTGSGVTYGHDPPAAGYQLLQGPVGLPNGIDDDADGEIDDPGERLGMTSALGGYRNPFPGSTWDGPAWYFRMQGRWNDGTPITELGGGYGQAGRVTRFAFPGDPVPPAFWSQRCAYPTGTCVPLGPNDQHITIGTGPGRLEVGDIQELLFAIPFARGAHHIESIVALRQAATILANAHGAGLLDAQLVPGIVRAPTPASIELRRPAPNPFTESATVGLSLPAPAAVRAAAYDVLGREIAIIADGPHDAGAHELTLAGARLAPGVYVLRVWVNGQPAGALPVTRR